MKSFTKEQYEEKFVLLSERIRKADKNNSDWYSALLSDVFGSEGDDFPVSGELLISLDAVQYPELYPLIKKAVKQIIKSNKKYEPVMVSETFSGGSFFAAQLALADPKYIKLFVKHFMTTHPEKEDRSNQYDGIKRILSKYGWRRETFPVFFALCFINPHAADDFTFRDKDELSAVLKQEDNLEVFLKMFSKWACKYDYLEEQTDLVFFVAFDGADRFEMNDETLSFGRAD